MPYTTLAYKVIRENNIKLLTEDKSDIVKYLVEAVG